MVACVAGGGAAVWMARWMSPVSPLIVAILLGLIVGNVRALPSWTEWGRTLSASKLIRAGVIALGFRLPLSELASLGLKGISGVICLVSTAFLVSLWFGRRLGLSRDFALLVGAGYGICGLSAVAALDGALSADETEVAYAMSLITLVGTASVFLLPTMATVVGADHALAGLWIGGAVHDVGQTIATATSVGDATLRSAIVMKLTRVALLAPVVAIIGSSSRARHVQRSESRLPAVPLFIVLFIAAATIRTIGVLPQWSIDGIRGLETWLFAAALFATGTRVVVSRLLRLGGKPLVHGLALWVATLTVSALIAWFIYQGS